MKKKTTKIFQNKPFFTFLLFFFLIISKSSREHLNWSSIHPAHCFLENKHPKLWMTENLKNKYRSGKARFFYAPLPYSRIDREDMFMSKQYSTGNKKRRSFFFNIVQKLLEAFNVYLLHHVSLKFAIGSSRIRF